METHLKIVGIILIVLSLIHFVFPKYFDWKNDLKGISLINRQMMWIHMYFIALTVLLMGLLCVTSSSSLVYSELGRNICLGLGIFWVIRLLIQFFGYSSKLWIAKTFETIVHILFSIVWAYVSIVFLLVYFL